MRRNNPIFNYLKKARALIPRLFLSLSSRISPLPELALSATFRALMTIAEKQTHLLEELSFFHDWQDRYEYVIALGKKLAPLPDAARDADHLIKGCQSQVWLDAVLIDGIVHFFADSDSVITKGMIALFVTVLDQQSPDDILQADMSFIEKTGLKEHLAPTRANALSLMATQMKQRALQFSQQS